MVLNFLSALLYPALAQGSIGAEAFIFFSIRQHLVVAYLAIYFRSLNFSDAYCGQCLLYKLLKRGLLFYQVLSFCLLLFLYCRHNTFVRCRYKHGFIAQPVAQLPLQWSLAQQASSPQCFHCLLQIYHGKLRSN